MPRESGTRGQPHRLHHRQPEREERRKRGFPGGFNWPIWAAQEKGYFAKGGIEVRLTPTPSSVFQLTGLIEGRFDIAETAIDNVIAYMEGQGEASVSVKPDLFVFMGGDSGLLSLAVLPEIKTYADLKGKTLSVDASTE
jgi:ABC-type nitrate/sulfonate/bicarbonate transport system substrate-binding protein